MLKNVFSSLVERYLQKVSQKYHIPFEDLTDYLYVNPGHKKDYLRCKNLEFTDEYNPGEDELDYSGLIRRGFVMDHTGVIKKILLEDSDIKTLAVSPVYSFKYIVTVDHSSGEPAYLATNYYDVVKSNLQKMVRRGKVLEACKSAYEMYQMSKINKMCLSNLVNRLCKVILSEDLSIGANYLITLAYELITRFENQKTDSSLSSGLETENLQKMIEFINLACLGKKTRLIDYLYHYYWNGAKEGNIPGIVYGPWSDSAKLFREGLETKNLDLAMRHMVFLEQNQGSVSLSNDSILGRRRKPVYSVWKIIFDVSRLVDEQNSVDDQNSLLDDNKETLLSLNHTLFKIYESHGENILNLIHAAANIVLYDKAVFVKPDIKCQVTIDEVKAFQLNPDAVSYDCHTSVGRSLRKTPFDFYRYGCKTNNKLETIRDLDRLYFNRCFSGCFMLSLKKVDKSPVKTRSMSKKVTP